MSGRAGRGRKALVTGAAGFIGSHLVERLLATGWEVVGADDFDPWYDPQVKRANLSQVDQDPRFTLVPIDLTVAPLSPLIEGVDTVFHLAGRPGVSDSWGEGFADSSRLNVQMTQQVLEAALVAGVGRVVYASSSSVYGGDSGHPGRPVEPISPYGVSKAAGEQLAEVYRRRGLDVVTLRYFTVYGPRQRPDMAIHRLLAATDPAAPPFHRRGSGLQRRQFTYVGDVVTATVAAGANDDSRLDGAVLDVGGGETSSLNDLIDLTARITGRRPQLIDDPPAPGDPQETVADLDPTERLLDWRPTTSLADGLAAQWRWQRPASGSGVQASENGVQASENGVQASDKTGELLRAANGAGSQVGGPTTASSAGHGAASAGALVGSDRPAGPA